MSSVSEPRESSGMLYRVREWFITGAALTISFLITVMVLAFVLNFLSNVLTPVASTGPEPSIGRAVETTDAGREVS
jgi:uncharacterized membrane protein